MKKIPFLFIALLLSAPLLAWYPIPERPLRMLVIESEYIIRGKVLKTGKQTPKDKNDHWNTDYAIISIKEVWQGSLKEKEVKVYFTATMSCPQPGVFYDGEEVLAFIDKREKADGYEVHALSYGVKHKLTEQDFLLYKTRTAEMQDILRIKDEKEKETRTLDWLVTCAANRATRYEGVADLVEYGDFMSVREDDGGFRSKNISMSAAQQKRLFDALMREDDNLGYYDMEVMDMVTGIDDKALVCKLQRALRLTDMLYLYPAYDMMRHIGDLSGNADLKDIAARFAKLNLWEDEHKAEGKSLYLLFIQKMGAAECEKVDGGRVLG